MLDQDIKTEKDDIHRDALRHSHPSFGMISVSRVSGRFDERLFGCETINSNAIRVEIDKATVVQDLGRNWYHGKDTIVSVYLSPVQYAEMISNPNTTGVPCTIDYTSKDGRIAYKPIDSVTEYCESKIEEKLGGAKDKVSRLTKRLNEILSQKGGLKKADKEQAINLVRIMAGDIIDALPFYEEQFKKSMDRTKMEAKAEIDSFVTHAIASAGIQAINNPEALKILIENKEKGE